MNLPFDLYGKFEYEYHISVKYKYDVDIEFLLVMKIFFEFLCQFYPKKMILSIIIRI